MRRTYLLMCEEQCHGLERKKQVIPGYNVLSSVQWLNRVRLFVTP